ncbi:MAG: NADH-quinone oxidoreductase subunit L [Deltaproteobacteria bacterium]|nr:NADH-quinone oxidoreductase subunit L [Deltaproteobacteria bacterium]
MHALVRDNVGTLLWVVVFAPLAGAIVNGILGPRLKRGTVSLVGVGAPVVAFVASALATWGLAGREAVSTTLFTWIQAGPIRVDLSLWLDPLSAVMILIVTGIGSLIHLYSTGYMHGDPSYSRYFSHLNLFLFAMLLLVLGKSLLLLFVGWEGVGLCSYLLIGFWFDDMAKAVAGKKAFLVNRIGDFGFLLGMFVLVFWMEGSLDVPALRDAVDMGGGHFVPGGTGVMLVTLALFLGATGKSAQIPLHVWLPDAMAGPTPVSALIHAATMVTAGVYMIARLNFLFALAPTTMAIVALTGAATALFAASIGLVQNDIKKVLAYSTVSQLGYMVLGAGVGAFGAGVFHLMTHAFFKACLFLGAGSVIHAMAGCQDIRLMGGLGKRMPWTRATFLVSTLAIAGVPLLSGFFSKDEILYKTLALQPASGPVAGWIGPLCFAMALAAALLTATYMFRLYFLTFSGELRSHHAHPHESPASMTIPLVVLAAGAALAGYVGLPIEHLNFWEHWLHPVFEDGAARFVSTGSHALEYGLMGVSTVVACGGIALAWALWRGPLTHVPAKAAAAAGGFYRLVCDRYRIDELYDAIAIRPFQALARVTHRWLDAFGIDAVLVNGPPRAVGWIGSIVRVAANGDVQAYAAALFVGLAVLLWLVIP